MDGVAPDAPKCVEQIPCERHVDNTASQGKRAAKGYPVSPWIPRSFPSDQADVINTFARRARRANEAIYVDRAALPRCRVNTETTPGARQPNVARLHFSVLIKHRKQGRMPWQCSVLYVGSLPACCWELKDLNDAGRGVGSSLTLTQVLMFQLAHSHLGAGAEDGHPPFPGTTIFLKVC